MKLGYQNIVVTFCRKPSNKKYEGKNIAEIARMNWARKGISSMPGSTSWSTMKPAVTR